MHPEHRKIWEHRLQTCQKTNDNWLALKYENSSTDYLIKHTCAIERSSDKHKKFVIYEDILINRGLQRAHRFYLIEEIANKEGFLRVTLFAKVNSYPDVRVLIK